MIIHFNNSQADFLLLIYIFREKTINYNDIDLPFHPRMMERVMRIFTCLSESKRPTSIGLYETICIRLFWVRKGVELPIDSINILRVVTRHRVTNRIVVSPFDRINKPKDRPSFYWLEVILACLRYCTLYNCHSCRFLRCNIESEKVGFALAPGT